MTQSLPGALKMARVTAFPVLNGLHHDDRKRLEAQHALFAARMRGVASAAHFDHNDGPVKRARLGLHALATLPAGAEQREVIIGVRRMPNDLLAVEIRALTHPVLLEIDVSVGYADRVGY